ncbi:hypothetical protein TSUD_31910 [Trifolium subterraneum]|uniref:Pectinesterase n=1 Tax=Trifolium subterraneum TaxID=3900 RepID=A0A2Z6M9U6_TRISU|nr:hypothetical protein TSUD_31910 [Trifolium subterraneum]
MAEEDPQGKKRIIIISVSAFLLVAMVVAVTVGVNFTNREDSDSDSEGNNNKPHVASTVKAVKAFCKPTDYKKECEDNLLANVGNTTDSRELIKLAFNITVGKIGDGIKKTHLLEDVEKEPRAKMALDTCKKLMNLSIGEFDRSLERIKKFDLNNLESFLMSLRVWLSGAITYQETCLDAFENTTSDASKKMKTILTSSMHMTSNALAIITDLSDTILNLNSSRSGRQLIDNEPIVEHDDVNKVPSWVHDSSSVGVRRLLNVPENKLNPDAIVAKDGSGKFKSINDALKQVPEKNQKPFVIFIKEGVYNEFVEVTKKMTHVVFFGEGPNKTRIIGKKNFIDGINTYNTATVAVQGDYFVAINMGFENAAGPHKHQAVAIRVQADKTIFYRCAMDGYQDTLYAHALRQYYRECTISGTIDFVFGDAVAVFQNCTFIVRKPLQNQQCIVTAQGRKESHQPSGIVIQDCYIVPENQNVKFEHKAYLARPWKNFSRTVFMKTYIGDFIQPDGYMPWQGPNGTLTGMDTCYYAEYNNIGPGSDKSKRVKWPGIKVLTSQAASIFLPSMFFHGDDWIRVTRIPYNSGEKSPKLPNSSGEKPPKQ